MPDRLGHQPLPGILCAHPVAQVDVLGGAAADIGEGQAADQDLAAAVAQEDEEGVVGARARPPRGRACSAGGEDAAAEIGLGPARLEGLEEIAAVAAQRRASAA